MWRGQCVNWDKKSHRNNQETNLVDWRAQISTKRVKSLGKWENSQLDEHNSTESISWRDFNEKPT